MATSVNSSRADLSAKATAHAAASGVVTRKYPPATPANAPATATMYAIVFGSNREVAMRVVYPVINGSATPPACARKIVLVAAAGV